MSSPQQPKVNGTGTSRGLAIGRLQTASRLDVPFLTVRGPGYESKKQGGFYRVNLYEPPAVENEAMCWVYRTEAWLAYDAPGDVSYTAFYMGTRVTLPVYRSYYRNSYSDSLWNAAPGQYLGRGQFAAASARVHTGMGSWAGWYIYPEDDTGDPDDIPPFWVDVYAPESPMELALSFMHPGNRAKQAAATITGYTTPIDEQTGQFPLPQFIGFDEQGSQVFVLAGTDIGPVSWSLVNGKMVASFGELRQANVAPKLWRVVVDTDGNVTQSTKLLPRAIGMNPIFQTMQFTIDTEAGPQPGEESRADTLYHVCGNASCIGPGRAIIPVATFLHKYNLRPERTAAYDVVTSPELSGSDGYQAGYYLTDDYGLSWTLVLNSSLRDMVFSSIEAADYRYVSRGLEFYNWRMQGYELAQSAMVYASRTRAVAMTPDSIVLFTACLNADVRSQGTPPTNPEERTASAATFKFYRSVDGGNTFFPGVQEWHCNTRLVPSLPLLQPNVPSSYGFLVPCGAHITPISASVAIAEVYDGRDFSAWVANYQVLYFKTQDGGSTWSQLPMPGLVPSPLGSMSSITGPITVVEKAKGEDPPVLAILGALDSRASVSGSHEPRSYKTLGLFFSRDLGESWALDKSIGPTEAYGIRSFIQPSFFNAARDESAGYLPASAYPNQLFDYRARMPFVAGSVSKICDPGGRPAAAHITRPWLYDPLIAYEE